MACEHLGWGDAVRRGRFGLRIWKSLFLVGPIPSRGVFYRPIFPVLSAKWGRGLGWGNFSSCLQGWGSAYPSGFSCASSVLSWFPLPRNCPSGSPEQKATLETAVFPPCWGRKAGVSFGNLLEANSSMLTTTHHTLFWS